MITVGWVERADGCRCQGGQIALTVRGVTVHLEEREPAAIAKALEASRHLHRSEITEGRPLTVHMDHCPMKVDQ